MLRNCRHLCVGVLACIVAMNVHAEGKGDKPRLHPVRVVLRAESPFNVTGTVKIKDIDVGVDNIILLRLVNSSASPLDLRNANTSCGCVKLSSELSVLPPNKECDLEVRLHPERSYKSSSWQQVISFESLDSDRDKYPPVSIMLYANLSGVFAIEPRRVLFLATPDERAASASVVREIEVSATPPVVPENFRFVGGDILNLVDIELIAGERDPSRSMLRMTMKANEIPVEGFHTNLSIVDPVTKRSLVVPVSGIRRPPVRVVPSLLMLQPTDSEKSLSAFALLVCASLDLASEENEVEKKPFITARVGKTGIPVEVIHSTPKVCRLKVTIDVATRAKVFSETTSVKCVFDILWRGTRHQQSVDLKISIP